MHGVMRLISSDYGSSSELLWDKKKSYISFLCLTLYFGNGKKWVE